MKSPKLFGTLLSLTLLLTNGAAALSAQTRSGARPRPAAGAPAPATAANDIKVRARTTTAGHTFEDTQYIKGARERREMNAGGMTIVSLMQCDLKRQVQINEQSRTYMVSRLEGETASETAAARAASSTNQTGEPARRGGVVTYVNTSTDTGERKQVFGHTARRIKTVTTVESSPDACDRTQMRSETDGWYIDIKYGLDCRNLRAATPSASANGARCTDQFRFKQVGVADLGFPVDITMTHYNADGSSTSMRREVVELSRQPLDAALFDVPAGDTEASSYQHLMT
ncbi:MAG TPA: hypothetical protein VEQ42_12995, partial [Pyrinomonadaceae bacterium]|nr:hypothetical protein [Pyrinomonadaceae bacterium]